MIRATIILLVLATTASYAGTEAQKPKSMALAWVLALDPIPGDALFYAKRPVQGTVCALAGGIMGLFFFATLPSVLDDDSCNPNDSSCVDTSFLGDFNKGATAFYGALYAATLLWDGMVGIHYVKEYNRKIKEKSTGVYRFQPILGMNSGRVTAGLQFQF